MYNCEIGIMIITMTWLHHGPTTGWKFAEENHWLVGYNTQVLKFTTKTKSRWHVQHKEHGGRMTKREAMSCII